jgi:putative FmdB family regulatory protein
MALYEYRCPDHGATSVSMPMGTAPTSIACPICDGQAERVYSAPMLMTSSSRRRAAVIDHCEKSRHEPEVVTSPPRREPHSRTQMAPANPALRRLPRP